MRSAFSLVLLLFTIFVVTNNLAHASTEVTGGPGRAFVIASQGLNDEFESGELGPMWAISSNSSPQGSVTQSNGVLTLDSGIATEIGDVAYQVAFNRILYPNTPFHITTAVAIRGEEVGNYLAELVVVQPGDDAGSVESEALIGLAYFQDGTGASSAHFVGSDFEPEDGFTGLVAAEWQFYQFYRLVLDYDPISGILQVEAPDLGYSNLHSIVLSGGFQIAFRVRALRTPSPSIPYPSRVFADFAYIRSSLTDPVYAMDNTPLFADGIQYGQTIGGNANQQDNVSYYADIEKFLIFQIPANDTIVSELDGVRDLNGFLITTWGGGAHVTIYSPQPASAFAQLGQVDREFPGVFTAQTGADYIWNSNALLIGGQCLSGSAVYETNLVLSDRFSGPDLEEWRVVFGANATTPSYAFDADTLILDTGVTTLTDWDLKIGVEQGYLFPGQPFEMELLMQFDPESTGDPYSFDLAIDSLNSGERAQLDIGHGILGSFDNAVRSAIFLPNGTIQFSDPVQSINLALGQPFRLQVSYANGVLTFSIPEFNYSADLPFQADLIRLGFHSKASSAMDVLSNEVTQSRSVVRLFDLSSTLSESGYRVTLPPLRVSNGGSLYDDSVSYPQTGNSAAYILFDRGNGLEFIGAYPIGPILPLDGTTNVNAFLISYSPQFGSSIRFTLYSTLTVAEASQLLPQGFVIDDVKTSVLQAAGAGDPYLWNGPCDSNQPSIWSFSPATGPAGTLVTVIGRNFGMAATTSSLRLGSNIISTEVWNDRQIDFVVPDSFEAGAYPIGVQIQSRYGTLETTMLSPPFTVVPVITALSPNPAGEGDTITVSGTGFGSAQAATNATVTIGGILTTIVERSPAQMRVIVPLIEDGNHPVVVRINGVDSAPAFLTITSDPTIQSLAPKPSLPGEIVTLTGLRFGSQVGALSIDGDEISVASWSSLEVKANIALDWPLGTYLVTLTTARGKSTTAELTIAPRITRIIPTEGAAKAAQNGAPNQLFIDGKGFGDKLQSSAVLLDEYPLRIVGWTDTRIVVEAPTALAAGTYDLTVQSLGVRSNALPFKLLPSLFSVAFQLSGAESRVLLSGSNFGATGGVSFGDNSLAVISWTNSQIVAIVPPLVVAAEYAVSILTNGIASSSVKVTIPLAAILAETEGRPGSVVTITGRHFGTQQPTVKFGGFTLDPLSWSGDTLTFQVPNLPDKRYDVSVGVSSGVWSANMNFIINSVPSLNAVLPEVAAVGSEVTLQGLRFGTAGAVSLESMKTSMTVIVPTTSWSDRAITFMVPPGTLVASYRVTVQVGSKVSNIKRLQVTDLPYITAIIAPRARIGATVRIIGGNFGDDQGIVGRLTFGREIPVEIVSWSYTAIEIVVPIVSDANYKVSVSVGDQMSNSFNFEVSTTPHIDQIIPTEGPEGITVTVLGYNFGDAVGNSLLYMGADTTTPVTWSDSSIMFFVPNDVSFGRVDVYVVVSGLTSNAVRFLAGAGVTSVTPARATGGDRIVVVGGGFGDSQGASYFKIGGMVASVLTWSDTQVTLHVPDETESGPQAVIPFVSGSRTRVYGNLGVFPTLLTLDPGIVLGGITVIASGTNFSSDSTVSVGGVEHRAHVRNSNVELTFNVSEEMKAGDRQALVVSSGESSNALSLVIVPTIVRTPDSVGISETFKVKGRNFGAAKDESSISLDGVNLPVMFWSSTSIEARVPTSFAVGTYVLLITVGGQSASTTITVIPVITSISPSGGTGGDLIAIQGFGFGVAPTSPAITVAGQSVAITSWNNRAISFVVPTTIGAAVVPVDVTVAGETSEAASFTVYPHLLSVSPLDGVAGTILNLTGTNFGDGGSVTVGASQIPVTSWSNFSVSARLTSTVEPGLQGVKICRAVCSRDNVNFIVIPSIEKITDHSNNTVTSSWVGRSLILYGANLGASQRESKLYVGDKEAVIMPGPDSWASTKISFITPYALAGIRDVSLSISTPNIQLAHPQISITMLPHIDRIRFNSELGTALAGDRMEIFGTNFGDVPGSLQNASSVISWSDRHISARIGSADDYELSVQHDNGDRSNIVNYTAQNLVLPPLSQLEYPISRAEAGMNAFINNWRITLIDDLLHEPENSRVILMTPTLGPRDSVRSSTSIKSFAYPDAFAAAGGLPDGITCDSWVDVGVLDFETEAPFGTWVTRFEDDEYRFQGRAWGTAWIDIAYSCWAFGITIERGHALALIKSRGLSHFRVRYGRDLNRCELAPTWTLLSHDDPQDGEILPPVIHSRWSDHTTGFPSIPALPSWLREWIGSRDLAPFREGLEDYAEGIATWASLVAAGQGARHLDAVARMYLINEWSVNRSRTHTGNQYLYLANGSGNLGAVMSTGELAQGDFKLDSQYASSDCHRVEAGSFEFPRLVSSGSAPSSARANFLFGETNVVGKEGYIGSDYVRYADPYWFLKNGLVSDTQTSTDISLSFCNASTNEVTCAGSENDPIASLTYQTRSGEISRSGGDFNLSAQVGITYRGATPGVYTQRIGVEHDGHISGPGPMYEFIVHSYLYDGTLNPAGTFAALLLPILENEAARDLLSVSYADSPTSSSFLANDEMAIYYEFMLTTDDAGLALVEDRYGSVLNELVESPNPKIRRIAMKFKDEVPLRLLRDWLVAGKIPPGIIEE